jgi:hypothetical protein
LHGAVVANRVAARKRAKGAEGAEAQQRRQLARGGRFARQTEKSLTAHVPIHPRFARGVLNVAASRVYRH